MLVVEEKFNSFLIELRKEQGLTQKALSEKLHVSASTISKWETGAAKPDIYLLESLANALNVTLVELISCEKEPESSPYTCFEAINKMLESLLLAEKQRSKRQSLQWFAICILSVLLLISVIGNGYLYYVSPPRMNIVDEYYDNVIEQLGYDNVYRVIVEYDGRITEDSVINFPEQIRWRYEKYFSEVDVILITYYSDYKGKDYIDNYSAMSVLLPDQKENYNE